MRIFEKHNVFVNKLTDLEKLQQINKLLIIKNRHISPVYRLIQARGEMRPSSDRGC